MNEYRRNGWIVGLLVALIVAVAAGIAYNVGLSQGLAQVGPAAGSAPPYAYGWHRPWGFGFFPGLFFFIFVVMLIKGFWWRPWGPWGRWSYYHYGPPPHVRDRFDEWHRQAHERMGGSGEAGKV